MCVKRTKPANRLDCLAELVKKFILLLFLLECVQSSFPTFTKAYPSPKQDVYYGEKVNYVCPKNYNGPKNQQMTVLCMAEGKMATNKIECLKRKFCFPGCYVFFRQIVMSLGTRDTPSAVSE